MKPADAQRLLPGDLVGMRYLGDTRWARVKFVTSLRVYLSTDNVPGFLRPLALEWVRPALLVGVVMRDEPPGYIAARAPAWGEAPTVNIDRLLRPAVPLTWRRTP